MGVQERGPLIGRFYSRVQFNFLLSSVPGARILQQAHESKQLTPSDIRDGTILETVGPPKDQVIPIPRHLDRQGSLSGGPADHIDDVRAVPVDDYSGALMLQIVDTSANELVPLWFKVGDDR